MSFRALLNRFRTRANHRHFLSLSPIPRREIVQLIPVTGSQFFQYCADAPQALSKKPTLAKSTSLTGSEIINVNAPKASSFRSSLNEIELAKFSAIADTWWDAEGPFKPLHALNPARLAFIRSTLCHHFRKDPNSAKPFEGLKFVDVGCGGGILSEPLARMGASVTGIDAVEKNIKIARLHAELDPATSTIEYCCTTAEKLVEEQKHYDAVISLEVEDLRFLNSALKLSQQLTQASVCTCT